MSNPKSEKANAFGVTYLQQVLLRHASSESSRIRKLDELDQDRLTFFGTCLSILYRVSTCQGSCRGGDHRLEYITGRAYNLGECSFTLLVKGYYDESHNLVRSLSEIANIFALFSISPKSYSEWISSDRQTRMREFSPVQVRIKSVRNSNANFYPIFSI